MFTITNFTPVGIKKKCYPVKYCSLCRGELSEACSVCIDSNNLKKYCKVKNTKYTDEKTQNVIDVYQHQHCYDLLNSRKIEKK